MTKRPAASSGHRFEVMSWARALPFPIRERVEADAYEQSYDIDTVVAHKGELANTWIGVADGLLKISAVYRSGKVVMFTGIPQGSWVGEGSVIKREPRRYDIIAMRRTRVIHIPGATFRWLLDTSFEFNHFIIAHLNERLAQYIGMVEIDRLSDPVARLARAIASLFNPVLYPQMDRLLPISQAELGELTGLSRQTTNNSVKRLQQEGLLSAEYGGVLVKDLIALSAYQERDR